MTFEEESALLKQFIDDADGGQIMDVSAIKAAYDEKVGHETGHGQIYYVLPARMDKEDAKKQTGVVAFL